MLHSSKLFAVLSAAAYCIFLTGLLTRLQSFLLVMFQGWKKRLLFLWNDIHPAGLEFVGGGVVKVTSFILPEQCEYWQ